MVDGGGSGYNPCLTPTQGCPCDDEGSVAECGKVLRSSGDYLWCSVGHRTCTDGEWGECVGDRTVQIASDEPPPFDLEAVPSPQTCVDNPCDPYCMEFADGPEFVTPRGPIVVSDAGVTLTTLGLGDPDAAVGCESIEVFPSPQYFLVTSLDALSSSSVGSGTKVGLLAEYFDQIDSAGVPSDWMPTLSRIDPRVDFYWGSGSPDSTISADYFSARWTGRLVPPVSGDYTFYLALSDGARLWLDDVLVLDAWNDRAPSEVATNAVPLNAEQGYDFRLETYERTNTAWASLSWSGPGTDGIKTVVDSIYFRPPAELEPDAETCSAEPAPSCDETVLQAESMYQSTGGGITDGWNIWSVGYISEDHTFVDGTTPITVRAKSDYVNYAWANMVVSIGGVDVYTTAVDSADWKEFSFDYDATAGTREIRVRFTNDYYSSTADRNLYVDRVTVGCPPPPVAAACPEEGPGAKGTLDDPILDGERQFEVRGLPEGCFSGDVQAIWTLDKLGSATIDNDGQFKLVAPTAGEIQIQANAGSFVATGVANVIVRARDDGAVTDATSAKFDGPGSGTDPMTVLYPYVDTVFPLGIRAPVVQWDKNGTNADAVRIALVAPDANDPDFLWEAIIPEPSVGRYEIPLAAWKALEQTAKGGDAAYVVQRLASGNLLKEVVRPFKFADAPLRGQIIYTEYGRGDFHAFIMSADPGSVETAVNMFRDANAGTGWDNGSECPVCHSVSAGGTAFVTSDSRWSGTPGVSRVESDQTLTQLEDYSPDATYRGVNPPGSQNFRGFAWAPITPDGKYAISSGTFWGNTRPGDVGFDSNDASVFPSTIDVPTQMVSGGTGTGLLAQYFANTDFSGDAWQRVDPFVRFDWEASAPSTVLNSDAFSVRWEGEVQAYYTERYTFRVNTVDGVRLTVGGDVLIDELDNTSASSFTGSIDLRKGERTPIVLEYVETGGNARVELEWQSLSTPRQNVPQTQLYWDDEGRGLVATYFDNDTFSNPVLTRVDPEPQGNWGNGSAHTNMGADYFSVRWEGSLLAPTTADYRFCVDADDGYRLVLDGTTLLNSTSLGSECTDLVSLDEGQLYPLLVELREYTGQARIELTWEAASGGAAVIAREPLSQVHLRVPDDYSPPSDGLLVTSYADAMFNATLGTNPTNPRALSRVEPNIEFQGGASQYRADFSRLPSGTNISTRYTGQLEAPCTGRTRFRAAVDDSVKMWLDGILILGRNGPGMAYGFKYMTEGNRHDIKLDWQNADGDSYTLLQWKPCEAADWVTVPSSAFSPSGDAGDAGFVRAGGDNGNGDPYWVWELTTTENVVSTDVSGQRLSNWGLANTTMMVPTFSPDGTRLVFVDGDQGGGAGWRKGLSIFDFDQDDKLFRDRRLLLNNWPYGDVIKWPTFESDSRSIVYSAGPPRSRCCVNIRYTTYGNMAPTDNFESPGRLYSINSDDEEPTPVALARASDGERKIDANKAWQPTMLPVSAGGYRWVVFTSTRPYGNTLNTSGQLDYTNFDDYTPMLNTDALQSQLWVAAVDDSASGDSDRSYPAFWLPNQRYADNPANGMINERGFWALQQCRETGTGPASECEVDEDCCGGGGDNPTAACKVDVPVGNPITRHCGELTEAETCALEGEPCATSSDCCADLDLLCSEFVCQAPPQFDEYTPANFERIYQAECRFDATPEWHFFDWQATTPDTNSYIDFYAQTAANPDDFAILPPVPDPVDVEGVLYIGRAIGPSTFGTWVGSDVGELLAANGIQEQTYVKITARFVPNQELSESPILHDFRMGYSCPPNQ